VLAQPHGDAGAPVRLRAADGVRVLGRHCEAGRPDAPPILLFHQAGSSKDEYSPIKSRLAAAGYPSLAK
jgi:hypothetical protein